MPTLSFTPVYHTYNAEVEAWVRDYCVPGPDEYLSERDTPLDDEIRAMHEEGAVFALVQPELSEKWWQRAYNFIISKDPDS